MLKSGIYGVFRLDGAPVDPGDVRALGLSALAAAPGSAHAEAVDGQAPDALHRADDAGALTILVGDLEEPTTLAARLNLPPSVAPAMLARAALQRFGDDTPGEMIGEWSLLHWDRADRLILMTSAARRDPLLFARSGPRVAVSPDLFRLSKLPWIGTSLDESGLLFSLGRADLRGGIGDRTMLEKVRLLQPGESVTISPGQCRSATAPVFVAQPRWTGTFEDAVVEAEEMMRRIMRGRMRRTAAPAILLSGGLDSSTLAWIAAQEREAGQTLGLITSVAPPGSGLADEAQFADIVADRLGLNSNHVAPPDDANIYRPSDTILAAGGRALISGGHCLAETFRVAGKALGATVFFDGSYGEKTLTAPAPSDAVWRRLRAYAVEFRRSLTAPKLSPFHVRLAPHRLASLPEPVRTALHKKDMRATSSRESDLWGYQPGVDKAMHQATEFYPGALRVELPYRDLRLFRLFAGFPTKFLRRDDLDRVFARRMLADRLPDSIRLRLSGLPGSPDHFARLKRQAPAARARIAAFRKAEVQEWLDLEWLDGALARIAEHGPADITDAHEVLLTAITAEFLNWWRARS